MSGSPAPTSRAGSTWASRSPPPPGKIRFIGDFAAGVEAGGCVDVELFEGCVKMSVTAAVHAEAPDPTLLQACVTISFPVVGDESFCAKL